MQPITGTIHAVEINIDRHPGPSAMCTVTIAVDQPTAETACHFVRQPVQVWLVDAVEATPSECTPSECTPETYTYLKARLAAAEDNLAREVRSNQAAAEVRSRLMDVHAQTCAALGQVEVDIADMTASRDKYERKMNEWAEAHSDLKEAHKSVVADNARLMDMVNDRDAKVLALSLDNDRLAAELARVTDDMVHHVDASHRWAGDLETIMQRLGVSCARVDDARQTILDKLGDAPTFSDVTHCVSSD